MQNKNGKKLCVFLSAALLMTTMSPFVASAANNSPFVPAYTEEPEATADPVASADPTESADPTASADPTEEPDATETPEPTATAPAETPMEIGITANIYDDKNSTGSYDITFTADKSLPEITAFEMTVSFDTATVGTAAFDEALKKNGTTNVMRGDNSVTFTFSEAADAVSGKTLIGTVNITTADKRRPTDKNINVDSFTATAKDGSKIIFDSTLTAAVGPSVPELEKNEQAAFDLIKKLPEKNDVSFFSNKEKGEFINPKDLKAEVQAAQSKYKALSSTSKVKVDKALAAESLSADVIDDLIELCPKLEKTIGMVQIGYGIKDITAENALDYAFYFDVLSDLNFNPSDLLGAATALDEFNTALTAVNTGQSFYEDALEDADYPEKTDAVVNQYTNLQKASKHVNYKKYTAALTESATDLKNEITKKYDGSDKKSLIRLIDSIIASINDDQEISKDMPSFKISQVYSRGGWTVTLTRDKAYPEFDDGNISVSVYNRNNKLIDTGEGTFKKTATVARVSMTSEKATYIVNQKITVYVTYELNGTDYDLGSRTVSILPNSSSSSSGGGNNTYVPDRPGNSVFPTATPKPTPTKKPDKEAPLFNDLKGYEWAEEAIEGLYYAGIVSGMEEGIYNPSGLVTREQFSKMVVQLFGVSAGASATNFKDVKIGSWYAPYISAAVQAGYVQGQSDEYFGIGEHIMRQDMATILHRALGRDKDKKALAFTDNDKIAPYAYDPISELVGLGALSGYEDGSFKPRGTATRAEAAKVIWNIYNII